MVFVELIIATLKRLVMQMPTVLDVFSSFYPSLSPKGMILFTRHTRYRRDMGDRGFESLPAHSSFLILSLAIIPRLNCGGILTRLAPLPLLQSHSDAATPLNPYYNT